MIVDEVKLFCTVIERTIVKNEGGRVQEKKGEVSRTEEKQGRENTIRETGTKKDIMNGERKDEGDGGNGLEE